LVGMVIDHPIAFMGDLFEITVFIASNLVHTILNEYEVEFKRKDSLVGMAIDHLIAFIFDLFEITVFIANKGKISVSFIANKEKTTQLNQLHYYMLHFLLLINPFVNTLNVAMVKHNPFFLIIVAMISYV